MSLSDSYWQGNFCVEISPVPNTIIIFGASGDLTFRKLMPALFNLFRRNLFHENSRVVGCARTVMKTEEYRNRLREKMVENVEDPAELDRFLSKVCYMHGGYQDQATYSNLEHLLEKLEKGQDPVPNRTFYLATPASLYGEIVPLLGRYGITEERNADGWRHVVLEKPFGHDVKSARALDMLLHETLSERQIYRIDHYLGKETVQNIMMLRFANVLFEPTWSNKYIDNVQITVAEDIGIGARAGYYEKAGLLRDMFQNHMLEMLALVAMEMPSSFDANSVRDEKLKLINSIRPFPIKHLSKYMIRGQYTADGDMKGYCEEDGVKPDSTTETFVAAKVMIDNWRWHGVPFYLRSGKRLKRKVSEIAIQFKKVPYSIFQPIAAKDMQPDVLVLTVQPDEGMSLGIQAKKPGPKLCMGNLTLDFKYNSIFGGQSHDAYERLLLDAMLGDQTLFIRSDVIAASWRLLTPVLEAWDSFDAHNLDCPCHLRKYKAGSWGPADAAAIPKSDGFKWRNL
ncbi:glucose-6-phosphate dehydrogenase [Lentisphaerota bacterium ZTH]|nr:glucose-6-phosphate dehydrogenase [Lentisphaerota bacterium]WET05876.1 glucose-6-phosphate dehydrogenase [Lentisphaerota bacterium ZTH]